MEERKIDPLTEYKCAICGGIFKNDWTYEEAMKEAIDNFGEEMVCKDNLLTVCDDCYQEIRPEEHPEELAMAKESFAKMMEEK